MSLVTIALIGKENDPLYFYCKEDVSEYLHQQMIAYSALDVVEERKRRYNLPIHIVFPFKPIVYFLIS
jgi:hypothetical protein